jgi:hypothetical protein
VIYSTSPSLRTCNQPIGDIFKARNHCGTTH